MSKEAEDHWNYTREIIEIQYTFLMNMCEYLYKEAFDHGHKHSKEDAKHEKDSR